MHSTCCWLNGDTTTCKNNAPPPGKLDCESSKEHYVCDELQSGEDVVSAKMLIVSPMNFTEIS